MQKHKISRKHKRKIYVTLDLLMSFQIQNQKHNPEKERTIIWTLLKFNFCSAKHTVKRIKRQVIEREGIFGKPVKGLVSRI